jgi:type I restriction enzyme R subunit
VQKEAKARILINDLLRRSGWRFFDNETGPANIALEVHVKLKKKILDDLGDDFEKTVGGFVDYLLLDDRSFPIAVLEAKSALVESNRKLIAQMEAKIKAKLEEVWGEETSDVG